MAYFDRWTFEPAQALGNKRKNADFSAFVFSGRNECVIHELKKIFFSLVFLNFFLYLNSEEKF